MSARLTKKQKQARSQNSEAVIPKLTAVVDGLRKIKDNPPVIYHFERIYARLRKAASEIHRGIQEVAAAGSTTVVRALSITRTAR